MNSIIRRSSAEYEDFLFKEADKIVLKLRFNFFLSTARIEIENEKRVFIIEDEGLLKTKLVLKNEYGVRMGQLVFDNWYEQHGTVQIENSRFRFTIRKTPSAELQIYKNSGKNLIYTCILSFESRDNLPGTGRAHQFISKNYPSSYILALSWYLLQQSVRQEEPELSL